MLCLQDIDVIDSMKEEEHEEMASTLKDRKIVRDPPSKYELEAARSRATKAARNRAKLNKPVQSMTSSPYSSNTTSAALNLIQEALDGEDLSIQSPSAGMALYSSAFESAVGESTNPAKLTIVSPYKQHHAFDTTLYVDQPTVQFESFRHRQDNDMNKPTDSQLSTMERDYKRMQEGFRVKAFLNGHQEQTLLHLDKVRQKICISTIDGDEEKKDSDSERLVKIPLNQIFKLEFGRTGQTGTRLHPLKSFSIAIENGPSLFYYDFEAETPLERDHLVSSLIHVLEAIYSENEIRQDSSSLDRSARGIEGEKRDLEDTVESTSFSSVDGPIEAAKTKQRDALRLVLGDDDEGGTIDQPILCSPSLEMTQSTFVNPSDLEYMKTGDGTLARSSSMGLSFFGFPPSLTKQIAEGTGRKPFGRGLFTANGILPLGYDAGHVDGNEREFYESRDQQDWTNRESQHETRGYDDFENYDEQDLSFTDDDDERLDSIFQESDQVQEKQRAMLQSLLARSPGFYERNKYALGEPIDLIANGEVSAVAGHPISPGVQSVDLPTPDLAPDDTVLPGYIERDDSSHFAQTDDDYSPPVLVPGQFVDAEPTSSFTKSVPSEPQQRSLHNRRTIALSTKTEKRRQDREGAWPAYQSTNSFSDNSTVAISNVRSSRSNSLLQSTTRESPIGSSPHEPIFVDEGSEAQPIGVGSEHNGVEGMFKSKQRHAIDAIDDNQSHAASEDMGLQGHVPFMSKFRSNPIFDFSVRPPQSNDLRSSSSHQPVDPWCSDDVCTTTFNDMAQTCSGMFALEQGQHTQAPSTCIDPTILDADQIAVVQEYVNNALGAPSAVYEFFVEDPVPVSPSSRQKSHEPTNRVQNRATVRNAQAGRLRNLRKEMTFASALQQSRDHMQIRTTRSFNDAPPQRITNQAANQFLGSALLSSVVNTMIQHPEDSEVEREHDAEVAYYDSDPEDIRERTLDRGPRHAYARIRNVQHSNTTSHDERSHPPGLGKIRNKLSRKVDEAMVKEVVQVMQNDRLTLMWHPTQSRDEPNRSPTLVRLWIESGLQLVDGSFLLPKLTWTKINDGSNSGFKTGELHKLDLLDITRIRTTDTIDRERHPFASRRVSFIIESQTEVYLFEAETTEERARVVYGLKVVVARLASLLMLRDYRAAEEFFGSQANLVPGESPF